MELMLAFSPSSKVDAGSGDGGTGSYQDFVFVLFFRWRVVNN